MLAEALAVAFAAVVSEVSDIALEVLAEASDIALEVLAEASDIALEALAEALAAVFSESARQKWGSHFAEVLSEVFAEVEFVGKGTPLVLVPPSDTQGASLVLCAAMSGEVRIQPLALSCLGVCTGAGLPFP